MGIIITSLILTIITFFALGEKYDSEKYEFYYKITKTNLLSLGWLVIILFGCFTNIKANTVGIVYNPFKNGVQNYTLGQGYKAKSPFTKVYKISTEVKELTFNEISVQTSDSQYVKAIIKAQIQIDNTKAFEYFSKYRDKDLEDISGILSATIQKQLENITTQYNIMEVLGENRTEIVDKSLELIQEELLKDGIKVLRITLVDTDAGEKIENAIAGEAIAKKEAETAEYKKQKAQLEGEAKVIEAQKEKEANELINKTLTKEILTEKYIEKWDGKLPETYAGNDVLSIFNLK